MNLIKNIIKGSVPVLASLLVVATMAGRAYAIPYSGDSTPPAASPAFNVYTGVPSEGNESDFFRGKVAGDTAPSVSDVRSTCETGKRFQLRVYVHNGASQYKNDNGNGPSVAKDTKVSINLKNAVAKSAFDPSATISSSNAGSVTDGMTITCTDGRVVNLSYITGSASQFTSAGSKPVSDSIVTTAGAPVGTNAPDGNVWGCWEQRVYVTLLVEVKEVPKPPVVGDGVCKVTDLTVVDQDKRTVRASITGATTGQGASIVGYETNWGDGSAVSTSQTATHTYAKDGTYKIVSRVQVKLADGTLKWVVSDACTRTVTFKPGVPPIVPPVTPPTTVLPDTGAGNLFGIFAGVSAASAGAYQIVLRRRARA